MKLDMFDYELPEALIALEQTSPRSAARLLVQDGTTRNFARMHDLPDFLRAGDLLVFNDTKVIPARLNGVRLRGEMQAKVEITLIAQDPQSGHWRAMAKPLRKLAPGDEIRFSADLMARVVAREDSEARLAFDLTPDAFDRALAQAGQMPLPPYIAQRRAPDVSDQEQYQTIFAARPGAIAAPTAALHFDAALMNNLAAKGVDHALVTLHVGPGTFLPVKVDHIEDHQMHSERGEITSETVARIKATRAAGGRVIAVGTTALRVLETAAQSGTLTPWSGETDIFITPGYQFRAIDGLLTNFHLPRSTLLMLVSALMGHTQIHEIYAAAIAQRMRFYSYGDASLLLPARK